MPARPTDASENGNRLLWLLLPPADEYLRRRGDLVRAGLAAVGLGVTASLSLGNHVSGFEREVFTLINGLPDAASPVLWTVMQVGSFAAVFVAAGLALAARRPRLAVALATGGTATWFLAKGVKLIVERERPAAILHDVIIRGPAQSGLGFPSGHAAVAATIVTIAAPYLTPRARLAGWVIVWSVALARVFIGAHLPWDAVGGVFLGWGVGSLVNLIVRVPARR